ncbi:energy transducer TonB [Mangrovivirga cuniculi]|uniref:TonB C-terminal domain-containing protein n=1 Tax=Mangrovivirga cuniculi TaxID=2715131 RepID=A0A4D7JIH6_9BACT|nr:energy transducer TonB [Mangrovivirga cuniculi]QCK15799.1 hypothetical protein DCC35_14115 [Mangrovivirga cuniculi]
MRVLFLFIFSFSSIFVFSKELTLYYNDSGELTIPILATHYRVASFDSLYENFDGRSYEYDLNNKLIRSYEYDNGKLTGIYLKKKQVDLNDLDDAARVVLENKHAFVQAEYIRKNDYKEIKDKLSPLPIGYFLDSSDAKMVDSLGRDNVKIAEERAEFPGGIQKVGEFLSVYLEYPKEARQAGVKGKVLVEFVIDVDGSVTDAKVVRGIGHGCDEAALRAINSLPDWKPGYQRGKPVRQRMVFPITFR